MKLRLRVPGQTMPVSIELSDGAVVSDLYSLVATKVNLQIGTFTIQHGFPPKPIPPPIPRQITSDTRPVEPDKKEDAVSYSGDTGTTATSFTHDTSYRYLTWNTGGTYSVINTETVERGMECAPIDETLETMGLISGDMLLVTKAEHGFIFFYFFLLFYFFY
eukprot:GHVR01138665.1.p1 GENE.GHVR01138665.1~~GHVR01138665.1.p1  ORF type:complete len:162 (+),score=28.99 GHVR01138665.1:34-519(+)